MSRPSFQTHSRIFNGHRYSYQFHSAYEGRPTCLLLHGSFLGSCVWRHLAFDLATEGYGVIIPDLLGYGDSDKPLSPQAFRMSSICTSFAELLHYHAVQNVVIIGHEWGGVIAHKMGLFFPKIVAGIISLSTFFTPPGPFNLNQYNNSIKKLVGYEPYSLWDFWTSPEATAIGDDKIPRLLKALVSTKPQSRVTSETICHALQKDEKLPNPHWMTPKLQEYYTATLTDGKFQSKLNYFVARTNGVMDEDEADLQKQDGHFWLRAPMLSIIGTRDPFLPFFLEATQEFTATADLSVTKMDCGHWIMEERPDDLSITVLQWLCIKGLDQSLPPPYYTA